MQELLVDFITSLDGYGRGGLARMVGDWKDLSISPGLTGSRNGTTRS